MKPGKHDRKYTIRIQGAELAAFKECCLDLPESFGLDRRIAAYQGTRPIGFWRWDLDYLVDTLEYELNRPPEKRLRRKPPDPAALRSVYERLKKLRAEAYGDVDREPIPPGVAGRPLAR
jgi:hypothetical protein